MAEENHETELGSIPEDGGVCFRVWAPHADDVYVSGSFNDWAEPGEALSKGEGGIWEGLIDGVDVGDEYRYIIVNGKKTLSKMDPRAREVTHSAGNAIVAARDRRVMDDFTPPAWNQLVIYEMHVGTFSRDPEDETGQFEDVIERLGHLQQLGITAIEIMPAMEFAGAHSWGYNPACIFAIESAYGGAEIFRNFVHEAHRHGIAVILDVVYNHLGPSDLGLWQFDGWAEDDKGGIYFYNDHRAETPWGKTRPDYGREEVRQYLQDNAQLWLREYGVDGLRWDSTAYIRNLDGDDNTPDTDIAEGWNLMRQINDDLHEKWPQRIAIAEDLKANPTITAETKDGGAGFDAQWASEFATQVRETLITNDDASRNLELLRDTICHRYGRDAFERIIYTESHDEVANGKARLPEEIHPGQADSWEAKKRSTLGAVLVMTSPGIPMLFQGQELLEDQWFHDDDPVDWSRVETFDGILQLYRDLIHLRRNLNNVSAGLCGQHITISHLNNETKMLAYHRWEKGGPKDDVVVILNLANHPHKNYRIGLPAHAKWTVRLNTDAKTYDDSFEDVGQTDVQVLEESADGLPAATDITINAYSAIILTREE